MSNLPNIQEIEIPHVRIVKPAIFGDDRGVFVETFRKEWLPETANEMIQGNRATRQANTLVGLHFHRNQSDYWYVPFGRAMAVLADLRVDSPTYKQSYAVELSGENHLGLYIPPGVAHGFYAITDMTITYMVDQYYNPADELGIAWNDELWKGQWGITNDNEERMIISQRDLDNKLLADWSEDDLPRI